METDREEIVTTELHPFYVEGLGFVQAGCLQEGYELKCLDGRKETITGIRVEWLEEPAEVYNFEVADYHTYYVGDGDVLVHNTCSKVGGKDGSSNVDVNKRTLLGALKDAPVEYRKNPVTGLMDPYMKQVQITDDYKVILRRDIGDFNHGDF